jgi:hypothetical protein
VKLGKAPFAQALMFFSSIKFNISKSVEEMHMQLGLPLFACALDGGLYAALSHHGGLLVYGCDGRFINSMHADHSFLADGKGNFSSPF